MKVTIVCERGDTYVVGTMPDAEVMDLVAEWQFGVCRVISLTMDNAVVHIARNHIRAVEVEPEPV